MPELEEEVMKAAHEAGAAVLFEELPFSKTFYRVEVKLKEGEERLFESQSKETVLFAVLGFIR